MWKWIFNLALVAYFVFFPSSFLCFLAMIWGALISKAVPYTPVYLAVVLIGLLLGHEIAPPSMYKPLLFCAGAGYVLNFLYTSYRLFQQFLRDAKQASRDLTRLNELLRQSLSQAQQVFAGESTEIFFSRDDDRFAKRLAERYRAVGWKAEVHYLPAMGSFGSDHVVVITAPPSPEQTQHSLLLLSFSLAID